eukprot:2356555-Amphidinium_carterae.1
MSSCIRDFLIAPPLPYYYDYTTAATTTTTTATATSTSATFYYNCFYSGSCSCSCCRPFSALQAFKTVLSVLFVNVWSFTVSKRQLDLDACGVLSMR